MQLLMGSAGEAGQKWFRLDNAAKIYPAIMNGSWSAMFRLSCELKNRIDPAVLQKALEATIVRFPQFRVRMRKGVFWYYLDWNVNTPVVQEDVANPCARMDFRKNRYFLFRVRYFERRIALEIFHVLTDATGGMVFLKTLVAQYLKLLGHETGVGCGVLDVSEKADPEELEDAFHRHSNLKITEGRLESKAYQINGEREPKGIINVVIGTCSSTAALELAKSYGVTLTEFFVALFIKVLADIQKEDIRRRKLPIKISVPVNLRQFFPSKTLRNFSLYVNPGLQTRYGGYTFEEIVKQVHHTMRLEINEKRLNARMAKNVSSERNFFMRIAPLWVKDIVLGMAFAMAGESRFTSTLSNIGAVELPEPMRDHVVSFTFMLGPPRKNAVNCAVASYGGNLRIAFTRRIKDAEVERAFFTSLVKMGLHVKIESNRE